MSAYRKQDKVLAIVLLVVNLSLLGIIVASVYTGHDASQTTIVIIVAWVTAFTTGSITTGLYDAAPRKSREKAKHLSQAWD